MAPQRRASVREAAVLAGEQRTEDHLDDLLDFVKHVKLFAKLSPAQQKALCRKMTMATFAGEENIVNIGDADDRLYVVLSGSVLVQTLRCERHTSAEACDCGDRTLEATSTLKKGSCVGEAALQDGGGGFCGFALLAAEKTEVLVITRADYDKLAGPRQKQINDQRVGFLRQCPRVEDALASGQMTLQDLAAMADCLSEASCSGNEMVFQQGELVEHIIFVRTGQLAMLRTVDPGSCHSGRQPAAGRSDDPEQRKLLATNLAGAMCEIRARDRKRQLGSLLAAGGDGAQSAADAREASRLARSFPRASRCAEEGSPAAPRPEQGAQQQGGPAPPKPVQSGQTSWRHVSQAHRQAAILSNLCDTSPKSARDGDKERPASSRAQPSARATASSWRSQASREGGGPRVLRVGVIGAFQYFGDQQVWTVENYPVSLISDPVVELYMISKSDIMRRLPKRAVNALFALQKDELPTDYQLLQMQRQQERWVAFRRSMHAEAVTGRSRQASHTFRDVSSGSRVDVAANLEFLGLSAPDGHAHSLTLPAPRKGAALTPRDEELFSQAPARFLRSLEGMRNDPGLRGALAREGRGLRQRRRSESPTDGDGMDASSFFFELHWSKLRFDPIELSLSEDTAEDPLPPQAASASAAAARPAVAGPGAGQARSSRGPPRSSPAVQRGLRGRTPRGQARSSPTWAGTARS